MILRLAAALDVPLRHVNELLQACGYDAHYSELDPTEPIPEEIVGALKVMKGHHEPFPIVTMDRYYNVVDLNARAAAVFKAVMPKPSQTDTFNLALATYDPDGSSLHALLEQILAMPTVSDDWRETDLSVASSPATVVYLRFSNGQLRFPIMVTAFQALQTVWLDELKIETSLPYDAETTAFCQALKDG